MPPPSVRPATPVEARKPDGVAMPNATVAWSTSPQVHPRVGADGVVLRADRGAAQQRQVDDQGVVPHPEAGGVVAAAADGDLDAVLAGEPHAGDHVGDVAAARDGGRALVDHGVVDGACLVIPGIPGHDQVAAHGGGQLLVRQRWPGRLVWSCCVPFGMRRRDGRVHTEARTRSVRAAFAGARSRQARRENAGNRAERLARRGHARSAGAARRCRAPTPAARRSAGARRRPAPASS